MDMDMDIDMDLDMDTDMDNLIGHIQKNASVESIKTLIIRYNHLSVKGTLARDF